MISKVDELPPLRAHIDKVTNGQPSIHVSPNRMSNQNGINFVIYLFIVIEILSGSYILKFLSKIL